MVLNSLLQEQPDGSFTWSTDQVEVRVYYERLPSFSEDLAVGLGWTGYAWPANSNPWIDNFLFHIAGLENKVEAILKVEEFLRERLPGVLPEEPPSALSRVSGEGDLF